MQSSKKIKKGAIEDYISNSTQTELNLKANDADVLHKTGNEIKTSGSLTINDDFILPNLVQDVSADIENIGVSTITKRLVAIPIDESLVVSVTNKTGSTINKGTVVYINGAQGNKPTIAKSLADISEVTSQVLGVTRTNITNNSNGYVVISGTLSNLNTSSFIDGDQVFLSATIPGELTTEVPASPNHRVFIGTVSRAHSTQGSIVVTVRRAISLDEISDTVVPSPLNNELLTYESSTGLWKNKSVTDIGGVAGTGVADRITKWSSTNSLTNSNITDTSNTITIDPVVNIASKINGTLSNNTNIDGTFFQKAPYSYNKATHPWQLALREQLNLDGLNPLIERLKNNEALKLGITSSSTFAGALILPTEGTGYQCWKQVMDKFSNTASTIINKGLGGTDTDGVFRGGSLRLSNEMMSAEANIRTNNLDAIIININYNDGNNFPAYYNNMKRALLSARKLCRFVIVVPPLTYPVGYTTDQILRESRKAVYKAAYETGCIIMPIEKSLAQLDSNGLPLDITDPAYMLPGDIHPNPTGAAKYGTEFAKFFIDNGTSVGDGRQGIGSYTDPRIEYKNISWQDETLKTRRSIQFDIFNQYDGASEPFTIESGEEDFILRNSGYYSNFKNTNALNYKDNIASYTVDSGRYPESFGGYGSIGTTIVNPNATTLNLPLVTNANGGITFNGVDQRILTVPINTVVSTNRRNVKPITTDYSISVFVNKLIFNPGAGLESGGTIWGRYNTSNSINMSLYVDPTNQNLRIDFGSNSVAIPYASFPVVGTGVTGGPPTLITVTGKTNDTLSNVYINGVLATTIPHTYYNNVAYAPFFVLGGRHTTHTDPTTPIVRKLIGDIHMFNISASYTHAEEELTRYTRLLSFLNSNRLAVTPTVPVINTNTGTNNYLPKLSNGVYVDSNVYNAGNNLVGIGTNNPRNVSGYSNLTLENSTGGSIHFRNNAGLEIGGIYGAAAEVQVRSIQPTIPVTFAVNNVEKMRVNTTGNVLIGPIADSNVDLLQVGGSIKSNTGLLKLNNTSFSENQAKMSVMSNSTGLYSFASGGITMASTTQVNIGAVSGFIVDSNNPLSNPITVSYPGVLNLTPSFLGSAAATYFLVKPDNTLLQLNTRPTVTERRDNIYLGVVGHPSATLSGIGNSPDIIMNEMSQVRAMFEPTRFINEGVHAYANTANLNLYNTAGKLYGLGIGFVANGNNAPSLINVPAGAPMTTQYRTYEGIPTVGGTNRTTAVPDRYNPNGVGLDIPIGGSGNQATNQRIYLLANGAIRFQYGQFLYSTLADAIAGASNESFLVNINAVNLGILIGILAITKDCGNLQDTTKARFLPVSKFGETVGAAAGISIGTLQTGYNNSASPEITTNTILGAVSLKRGSAADTDNVLEIQNGAGTATAIISGQGAILANSITVNSSGSGALSGTSATGTALVATSVAGALPAMAVNHNDTGDLAVFTSLSGSATINNNAEIVATSFATPTGNSSQYLMADGSVREDNDIVGAMTTTPTVIATIPIGIKTAFQFALTSEFGGDTTFETFMIVVNGSSANYKKIETVSIGSINAHTLLVSVSGGDLVITANSTTGSGTFKGRLTGL